MMDTVTRVVRVVSDTANKITDMVGGMFGGSKETRGDEREPSPEEQGEKGETENEEGETTT